MQQPIWKLFYYRERFDAIANIVILRLVSTFLSERPKQKKREGQYQAQMP